MIIRMSSISLMLILLNCMLPSVQGAFAQAEESAATDAAHWYLPQKLTDQNLKVWFEVDSTWHMVEGKTANVQGQVSLIDENDARSISLQMSLPVASFDTDSSSRDERMREVMSAQKYPVVRFESNEPLQACLPAVVLRDGICSDKLVGKLTILSSTQTVQIPINIRALAQQAFEIEGQLSIEWEKYGVEDPSILIARLDPVATIFFKGQLEPQSASPAAG